MLALLAGFQSGCGFSPPTEPPCPTCHEPPPNYPILSDPYNVMEAYRLAYQARDSVKMKEIYDDTYIGTSIDQSSPDSIQSLTFNKSQEVSHVGAMAKATITSVTLTLPGALLRETDQADPPGWALIGLQQGTVSLQIDDGATSYVIVSDKENFEFRFVPTTPAPTSPTDTTWKIIRWHEFRN